MISLGFAMITVTDESKRRITRGTAGRRGECRMIVRFFHRPSGHRGISPWLYAVTSSRRGPIRLCRRKLGLFSSNYMMLKPRTKEAGIFTSAFHSRVSP